MRRVLYVGAALTLLLTASTAVVCASGMTAHGSDLNSQQARYYKDKADALERQQGDWFAEHAAQFSALTPAAGVLTVLVGFIALAVNSREARSGRRDTQFVEALKRFGDLGSAPSRASAAIALGQLAIYRHWLTRRTYRSEYYEPSVSQLAAGTISETDQAVLNAIKETLIRIRTQGDDIVADRVGTARNQIRENLARLTAGFVDHVLFWMRQNPDIDAVSHAERDTYLPLFNAAGNFKEHPASAIGLLTGEDVIGIQRLVFDNAIVNWGGLMQSEAISFQRSSLPPKTIHAVRRDMRLMLRKLALCAEVLGTVSQR